MSDRYAMYDNFAGCPRAERLGRIATRLSTAYNVSWGVAVAAAMLDGLADNRHQWPICIAMCLCLLVLGVAECVFHGRALDAWYGAENANNRWRWYSRRMGKG